MFLFQFDHSFHAVLSDFVTHYLWRLCIPFELGQFLGRIIQSKHERIKFACSAMFFKFIETKFNSAMALLVSAADRGLIHFINQRLKSGSSVIHGFMTSLKCISGIEDDNVVLKNRLNPLTLE